jgi:hypothetical protein
MLAGMPATDVAKSVPVIQVEASQVVLVRLAFSAVLADHEPGDRLEDFPGAQDRALVDLPPRDRAIRRCVRDAEKALLRMLDLGEVSERPLARHENFRGYGQVKSHVQHRGTGLRDGDRGSRHGRKSRKAEGNVAGR